MATGLEERNAESVAVARSNERKEVVAKPKADGLYGVVAGAKDKLAKDRAAAQRSDARLKGEEYSWPRKVASNLAIIPGAAEGLLEVADYALGDVSGTEDAWYRKSTDHVLDKNETRKRFLRDFAAKHGEDAAKKLDQEDREFLKNITVDQPELLRERNFPTGRSREGGLISDFLGQTVNEGFENTPLYKANPEFWTNLAGSDWRKDLETTYKNQYEFRRKLDFPVYGTFIEAHKTFTDEIKSLVLKDASMMQGWEEDFLAMGAGTIEFLSQIVGMDDDQPGLTPWQQRWEAGKMLTGGLIGTAVASLQIDKDNKVMGIPLPQLARKPAILTAVIGPGLVRALSLGKNTALGRAVAQKRKVDPAFNAFMKKAEGVKGKVASAVASSSVGRAAKAVGDIPITIPGTKWGSKIRDASEVIKEGRKKTARYSEEVAGGIRQRKVADLVKSGAKGALYWSWSGAPELGLYHPLVGTLHGTLYNSARYVKALDYVRKNTGRSADKAQSDLELAEQVGQAESVVAGHAGEARSTAASFILGLDQVAEYGAQTPGGLSILDSPQYIEQIQRGAGVLGSATIAGLPLAQVILPPNANLPTRPAHWRTDMTRGHEATPPPPKGVEAVAAFTALNSSKKIADRVRKLTDDAQLWLAQAIAKDLHKTNPVGFLEFVEKLPIKTRRFNQQYTRAVKPKVAALTKKTQAAVKGAFNSQYRRDVSGPVPGAPQPLKVTPKKPEPTRQETVYDTTRYVMEMPDGQKVRILSQTAQVLENQAQTRSFILEEARRLKAEIQRDIARIKAMDRGGEKTFKGALDEVAAERQPLFDAVEGTDVPTTQWRMGDDAQPSGVDPSVRQPRIYGVDTQKRPGVASVETGTPPKPATTPTRRLEVSDPVPGAGRLPDPVGQVGGQWAARHRLKELQYLQENLDLVDIAAQEFMPGESKFRPTAQEGYGAGQKGGAGGSKWDRDYQGPKRTPGSNAALNTMKELFAVLLEQRYLKEVTEMWREGSPIDVTLKGLNRNYGHIAVEAAIRKQRKMLLDERKGRGEKTPVGEAIDPLFALTPDGAIIDGTPLAKLVGEGAVPRQVIGKGRKGDPMTAPYARGEYMARQRKRSDKPLTDESRKGEMTDYFEQVGREPSDPLDPTGFREDKVPYHEGKAAELTKELKAEREAVLEHVDKTVDKRFDEAWKAESRGRPRQRKEAKEEARAAHIESSRAREFKKETGIPVGPKDVATVVDYLRKLEEVTEPPRTLKSTAPAVRRLEAAKKSHAASVDNLKKMKLSPPKDRDLAAKAQEKGRALVDEKKAEVQKAQKDLDAIKRSNATDVRTTGEGSFKAKVEKGWIPPLEEYISLSREGTAKLQEAIKARREGRVEVETRKLTPEELKRASAARKEISKIMRDNKELFDKEKDTKFKGEELEARLIERNQVLNKVSEIWQGLEEPKAVKAKPAAKPAPTEKAKPKAAPVAKWEEWLPYEFDSIGKLPRAERSGKMVKLARRILRDPSIPFEVKQDHWRKMIKGKDPHISPKYGTAKEPGGKPWTDDPKYSNWIAQIEGYIKGDRPGESLASTPGIMWQAAKGSKRLGDQLRDDIARIEKAQELTPDQKLTALKDLKNNILDDLYEGRREERGVYDYKEADYMSALGEQRLQGKNAVVSRVGTAAINRAKQTGRTVADEVAGFMEVIDTAVSRAKEASLRDPKSRASKATAQARNVWNGKEVSGVTPGFVKAIQDLQRKAKKAKNEKAPLKYTNIVELEFNAFNKDMPIHEQVALSAIAKKVVAADEAHHVNQGLARAANEVGIDRKAERNRIETAVSAVREALPELPREAMPAFPPRTPPPRPKAKAAPKAEPPKPPKKEFKEKEYKRVEEAVVPAWVKDDLVKKLKDFKEMGMSKTQAEAITAGFSDVWNQGLTMLASKKAKKILYEKVVEKIEASGVTLTKLVKENLEKQLNEYLSHFNTPFRGRERLAEYSLDLPGPQSAMGILEVAHRTLPDEFMFTGGIWDNPINAKELFFEALGDLKKKGKTKDLDVIQKEAFVELGNQFAAQTQVLSQNKIINGEMSRLGITRNSTAIEAAARVVVHRLLYQEALPLGLYNRLTKEVTKTVDGVEVKGLSHEAVSMKDLADLIRTERQYMVDAVKAEVNSARFATDRGSVKLTEKQIRRMMLEQDGPLQKIADALDKYEYRSKDGDTTNLNDFFKDVVDHEESLLGEKTKAERTKKEEGTRIKDPELDKTLDYTYQEMWSDKVFNASFNPEYLDSMMFNARLAQNQGKFLSRLTSGMKGNVTYESLMTNIGNALGHSLVAGMLTGELPTTFYARVAHETYLYSKFNKSPKEFNKKYKDKYPERVAAYNDLAQHGALEGVDWGSVEAKQAGPILAAGMEGKIPGLGKAAIAPSKHLNAYRNLRRKIYQLEDNGPRIAEAVREHIQISRELEMMEEGSKIAMPTGKKGITIITKGKKPKSRESTHFYRGSKNLKVHELAKLKASYTMKKVSGRVFNYKEVPRFIRAMRSGKAGAVGAFITPFLSFPYLSIDIPGVKKGIFGSILGDGLTSSSGWTSSRKVTAYRSMHHAKQKLRVLMWGLNMNQFSHPLNSDLAEMTRFNMEPGGTTAAMVRSSQVPNTIGVWRWNNANIFEASLLLMRNIFAMQAQIATLHSGEKARSNKNIEYFMRLNAEGKALTKNDVVRLGGLSGNLFLRSIMQTLPKQSNQDKGWWDLKQAWGHIGGSLIGVDDWNVVKTAVPMTGWSEIKDPVFSSFSPMIRDLEETDQLNFENMNAQEQMNFMVANWFQAFSRLYLRQRKISGGGLEVNNQARIALAAFKKAMLVPLDMELKTARGAEKEKLTDLRSMAIYAHSSLVEAYSNFYRAVAELEGHKRGRTKEEQAANTHLQRSAREVNNLRKSLEEARSKAVDALMKSKQR